MARCLFHLARPTDTHLTPVAMTLSLVTLNAHRAIPGTMPSWWHPLGYRSSPNTLPIKLFQTYLHKSTKICLRGDGIYISTNFCMMEWLFKNKLWHKSRHISSVTVFAMSVCQPLPEPLLFLPQMFSCLLRLPSRFPHLCDGLSLLLGIIQKTY